MPHREGHLELTWTNKALRLLAQEDGSYEWIPPADYRVAEARLLHSVDAVGAVHPKKERAKDNLCDPRRRSQRTDEPDRAT